MKRKLKLKPKLPRLKNPLKVGMAPGSLVFTGQQKMAEVKFSVMYYRDGTLEEYDTKHLEEVQSLLRKEEGVVWLNIDGLHDVDAIRSVSELMLIHKLTIEDILSVGQRPKIEEYENYLFMILRMFMADKENKVEDEQLSFVLRNNLLVTFQEKEGDVFSHVRNRIRDGKGLIRKRGADYLLYALVDSVVDYYFLILETLGDRLEELETMVMENPHESVLTDLHRLRREVSHLRRSVYPLREVVNRFERLDEPVIAEETRVFIRDLYDHTIQVIESIEVFRDMASGMVDLYMNSISNKMNNVMKVLTIIATIFIPLTFIAGIYGMNFEYMPELGYKWGYYGVWVVMLAVAVVMVLYFKKKKWF